jgi:opacity protein-like surface antigen
VRASCLSAILLLVFLSRPAAAQTPRWEVSGAYDFTRDSTTDVDFPIGWTAGGAYLITPWMSAAGEIGRSRKTIPVIGSEVRLGLVTYMAGLRLRRPAGRVSEFGQVLAGVVSTTGTAFGVASASTHFGLQPGAGLDFGLTRRLSARAEIDFRLVRGGDQVDSEHHVRFAAGVVYAFR